MPALSQRLDQLDADPADEACEMYGDLQQFTQQLIIYNNMWKINSRDGPPVSDTTVRCLAVGHCLADGVGVVCAGIGTLISGNGGLGGGTGGFD